MLSAELHKERPLRPAGPESTGVCGALFRLGSQSLGLVYDLVRTVAALEFFPAILTTP